MEQTFDIPGMRRRLAQAGALLFFLGMVSGVWADLALTDQVKIPQPHLALAAHLSALTGGLWLIATAWTFDFLSYNGKQLRRLSYLVGISAWSNWSLTVIASLFGVNGLQYNDDPANNVVAFLLQVFVVVPSLIGTGFWAWGFHRSR